MQVGHQLQGRLDVVAAQHAGRVRQHCRLFLGQRLDLTEYDGGAAGDPVARVKRQPQGRLIERDDRLHREVGIFGRQHLAEMREMLAVGIVFGVEMLDREAEPPACRQGVADAIDNRLYERVAGLERAQHQHVLALRRRDRDVGRRKQESRAKERYAAWSRHGHRAT